MNNCYNIGARYAIAGRILKGTTVIAYVMHDKILGQYSPLEKSLVEQLALNKQIYNCSAQIYGDIVNLKGINCKLSQLPKYNPDGTLVDDSDKIKKKVVPDLKLVGKVHTGRTVTSYIMIALNEPDKLMKIPKDAVIKLAQEGRIINAKSQMNGKDALIRAANGYTLSGLKTYK